MTEPLVSWRTWGMFFHVLSDKYRIFCLRDGLESEIWQPTKAIKKAHQKHGIYSWKNVEDSIDYMMDTYPNIYPFCFGEIYSWGKIEENKKGYQSEFAYPKKIYIINNLDAAKDIYLDYACETINIPINTNEIDFYASISDWSETSAKI